MVWLGGPHRRGIRGRGIYLNDPPPGYRPPRLRVSPKERQREAREEWVLMRVTSVILILAATAFIVIIFVIIATHM